MHMRENHALALELATKAKKQLDTRHCSLTFDDLVTENAIEGNKKVLAEHLASGGNPSDILAPEKIASQINNSGFLAQIHFLLDSGVSQERIETMIEESYSRFARF